MEFHNRFEGPNYGTINQAGRDVIAPSVASSSLEALVAATRLRAALDGLDLSPEADRAAREDLDRVERELRTPDPDRGEIARRLQRATETLKTAGALAAAGAALVGPIGVLAGFLGPLGEAVVKLVR